MPSKRLARIVRRRTATRRDRKQGSDHADQIGGHYQPVTLIDAGLLCLRAVQGLGVRATPTGLLARLDERSVACHRLRIIPAVPDEDRRTLRLGGDRGRHGPDRSPRPRQGLCAGQDENGSLQPRQIAESLSGLPTAATLRAQEKPPSNHGKLERSVQPDFFRSPLSPPPPVKRLIPAPSFPSA